MKMNTITTSTVLRVFFILLIVSVIGFLWQLFESQKTEIKAVGGTYREGIIGAPRFINPVLAQSQADHDLTKLIFSPLLTIDRDGSVHYGVIQSLERSSDGLQYTITLRNDIVFEDKNPLTSEDVKFTIDAIKDPQIKSPLQTSWEGIEVEIVDSYTLNFTLAQPFNDFLYNLEIGILPEHIWKDINPQEFVFSIYNTEPVASGPYRVKDIHYKESGAPEEYILTRSEHYFEENYIKNIIITFFDNEDDLMRSLNSGDIDAAYGISPNNLSSKLKHKTVHEGSLPRVFALFFNQSKQPLLQSENIRAAINLAIDKNYLINDIFDGYASTINSPFGFTDEDTLVNKQEAESRIASEGWVKNNEGYYTKDINGQQVELGFSIATPNLDEMVSVAESIRDDLAAVGIRVTVRSYDQGNLNQNIIRSRDYESLLFGYEVKKPSDMYAFWHSSQISDPGLNISLYRNTTVDNELDKLRSEPGDVSQINAAIQNDIPAVFLYSPSYVYVLPNSVHSTDLSITSSEDRFNMVHDWYIQTRHVWNIFVEK